jgi:hypothetical protein
LKNNLEIKKISKLKTQRANDKPTVRLFQGELIPESIIPQQLGIGPMNAFGVGFLDAVMAVWQNLETKKTIITGSESQGNCVKICEGCSYEDAVYQLADKEKAKEVYTEFGLSFIESFRAFIKNPCDRTLAEFNEANQGFLEKAMTVIEAESKRALGGIEELMLEDGITIKAVLKSVASKRRREIE